VPDMRTIRTKVYKFEELSEQAKEVAIENYRNSSALDDVGTWAVDDCALFEPIQTELDSIGFDSSKGFLIKNTRESIYFDTDRNSFLDCAKAMVITNDDLFLKWLGVPIECIKDIKYSIFTSNNRNGDTTIDFDNYLSEFDNEISDATKKFKKHIQDVLNRIEVDIDYRYTDESIIQDIEANDYEFTINGNRF
jgi:hypothetical protein